ncbi:hypothetical protein NLU13_6506 [Sarocladium strictum]|uniref:MIT domain-containing protein n=1 Tax=Sarocladium strictum TaxID=5046 RepID=A0AA39L6S6_SARSR|nr:hypothetical protein NLU13_6506 [Sarocladium strictum]
MQDPRPLDDPVALLSARLSTAGLSLPQGGTLPPPTRPAPSPSLSSPAIITAGRLPRTSSLLPPPHIASVSYSNPSSHPRGPSPSTVPVERKHRRGQSSSGHTVEDDSYTPTAENFYNLNRWSASTDSSRPSPVALRRPSTSTSNRRASSVDASAIAKASPPTSRHTTRKLQKNRRPSNSRSPSKKDQIGVQEEIASEPPKPIPILTLPGLPLLSPLPSLEQAVAEQAAVSAADRSLDTPATELAGSPFSNPFSYPPRPSSATAEAASTSRQVTMTNEQGQAHWKGRPSKGSSDSTSSRSQKPPSQKAMLTKALQKANTAVQLDNAHNFEGARQAYAEACDLLQQVLHRTSADEDKRKLEAIRRTYTSRIDELDQMGPWNVPNKALPARPASSSRQRESVLRLDADEADEELVVVQTATATRVVRDRAGSESRSQIATQTPAQPSLRSRYQDTRFGSESHGETPRPDPPSLQSSFSKSPRRLRTPDNGSIARSTDPQEQLSAYSPNRSSPAKPQSNLSTGIARSDFAARSISPQPPPERKPSRSHMREGSINSWLDPIDESGGSTSSSVHSRTSSMGYRRKHIRSASGDTEAEFDTALDAAIEAAYDEGYEPMSPQELHHEGPDEEIVANALRKVELARERVRQTEREAAEEEAQRQRQLKERFEAQDPEGFFDDNSSEEDERMLEEMTRDLAIEDFSLDQMQRPKPSIPRESDSSGFTSRTLHSSTGSSNPMTGTTSLNMSETKLKPKFIALGTPAAPPPTQSLPELPAPRPSSAAAQQSVRNRRLSGQKPKELKIETSRLNAQTANRAVEQPRPKLATANEVVPSDDQKPNHVLRRPSSSAVDPSPSEPRPLGSPFASRGPLDNDDHQGAHATSPSATKLRKNFSSSSLRSMKARNMSLSNLEDASDMSPGSPSTQPYTARTPALPALPSSVTMQSGEKTAGPSIGGHFLFATDIHSTNSPGIPNPLASTGIVALEPCPTDVMLRPFWLMRCLYQTLVNPRGGYVSQKLFVPRDVWRVKGVKLKNLEDKVFNCDLLTAALLKLAKVDSLDADAMLEEMQSLEGVLEQVQANLTRKLGNEVGVHGSGMLFKEASSTGDGDSSGVPRSASVSNKSSSFSWRRLRSKNSAAGLGSTYNTRANTTEADSLKDVPSIASLPMTPNPTSRPAKRDVVHAQFSGPYANYMAALARLFDAAQAIDQIARQVEDPGLRHADKTQVGLELCTRHAAEFFGFYICRFVMSDLGLLLDKFIKRGSEWVMV